MSSDELIFQADRIHSVSIHNVTLVANQINEGSPQNSEKIVR